MKQINEIDKLNQELYIIKEFISTLNQEIKRLKKAASIHYTDTQAHNEPFSAEAFKIINRGD